MSVQSAAAYLWGLIIGMGIVWLFGLLTPTAVIGTTFMWGVLLILAVLYDEWQRPEPTNWTWTSNQYTSRKP